MPGKTIGTNGRLLQLSGWSLQIETALWGTQPRGPAYLYLAGVCEQGLLGRSLTLFSWSLHRFRRVFFTTQIV